MRMLCSRRSIDFYVNVIASKHSLMSSQKIKACWQFLVSTSMRSIIFIHHFNLPLDAAFYFNFKGSIYGEIQGSLTSGSRIVPKKNFLATILLPCGNLDAKIKKFTGSDNVGDAPDSMTKAVHAFAHWSLLYSRGHILFCDLQGTILILTRSDSSRIWNWDSA
jgi:hypothetical protein